MINLIYIPNNPIRNLLKIIFCGLNQKSMYTYPLLHQPLVQSRRRKNKTISEEFFDAKPVECNLKGPFYHLLLSN